MTTGHPGPRAMSLLTSLREHAGGAERKVIDVVCENPADVLTMTAGEIAQRSGVSEATVARVWRKAGFDGFEEVKIQLAQDLTNTLTAIHEEVAPADPTAAIIHKVFQSNMAALSDTRASLPSGAVDRAADLIAAARQVLVCGVGNSGLLAHDAQQKWLRLGLVVHAAADGVSQAVHAALLREQDVLVAISHSGTSRDILEAAAVARESGTAVIAITQQGKTPLAQLADVVLPTVARETAFRSEAMSSRLCMISIIDTLFVVLAMRAQETTLGNLLRIRTVTRGKHVKRSRPRTAAAADSQAPNE